MKQRTLQNEIYELKRTTQIVKRGIEQRYGKSQKKKSREILEIKHSFRQTKISKKPLQQTRTTGR
jgi:hypothetical protein